MMIIGTIVATVFSALLYRMGGMGDDGRRRFPKLPGWLFDTGIRDVGCPAICLAWMIFFFQPVAWWLHFIAFGLTFASLRTYWDSLFGYDNFYFHGFMVGFSYLPYAIATGAWVGFIIRCAVLAVFMGLWAKFFSNDHIEEFGRGGSIGASLPIL